MRQDLERTYPLRTQTIGMNVDQKRERLLRQKES